MVEWCWIWCYASCIKEYLYLRYFLFTFWTPECATRNAPQFLQWLQILSGFFAWESCPGLEETRLTSINLPCIIILSYVRSILLHVLRGQKEPFQVWLFKKIKFPTEVIYQSREYHWILQNISSIGLNNHFNFSSISIIFNFSSVTRIATWLITVQTSFKDSSVARSFIQCRFSPAKWYFVTDFTNS